MLLKEKVSTLTYEGNSSSLYWKIRELGEEYNHQIKDGKQTRKANELMFQINILKGRLL